VRDSKLLTPTAREGLVPAILGWARDSAVGAAGAADVDRLGVTGALRLAGYRALAQLEVVPDLVLLDGAHDWLTVPDGAQERDLRRTDARPDARPDDDARPDPRGPPVVTRVKADLTCASVAAASILAKVARDAVMAGLARECPGYGWDTNMGYGTPDHLDALRRLGPTRHHRLSWRLPDRV
jgi:ribonuclease HII